MTRVKGLGKRCLALKEDYPEAEDVKDGMEKLEMYKATLEELIKNRIQALSSITKQYEKLKDEIKNLSKSLQRLKNELSVDCQVTQSGLEGLQNVAEIVQVSFI